MENYQNRKEYFVLQAKSFQKKYNQIANIRLFIFLAGFLGGIYFFYSNHFYFLLALFILCIALFIFLINIHQKITYQRDQFRFLSKINEDEILRLNGNIKHLAGGELFLENEHFYMADLDILGSNSLFQLINRTTTFLGGQKLASWLKKPASKPEIIQRQEAILELDGKIDFCQEFQARGMHTDNVSQSTYLALLLWLKEPVKIYQKPLWRILSYAIPALSLGCIALAVIIDYRFIFIPFLLNTFLLRLIFKTVQEAYENTYQAVKILKSYRLLLESIENEVFESPKTKSLKELIQTEEGKKASRHIADLAGIIYYLGQRQNVYFAIIADGLFLWDLHWLIRLEKWKHKQKENLENWFEAISEMEALNSLAGFYHANPELCFPVISEETFKLNIKSLAHPLIPKNKRIANSFELNGLGKTLLITGSNMSGKTTFQRTVGVNIVLALAGSAVCAEYFEISPLQVFTSMRTQDSLEENISSFYAELKRLKQLIMHLKENELPVLYLLDEILKGTNSQDRHRGAKALIMQLHQQKASGLVSTHDLELGALESQTDFIKNYSFNSEIIGDEIIFDYLLTEGICKSFNASKLMQKMGIEIKD